MTTRVIISDRGFKSYGPTIETNRGQEVSIYESSALGLGNCWLNVKGDTDLIYEKPDVEEYCPGEWLIRRQSIGAHLDRDDAIQLIAKLSAWLEDHPIKDDRNR